MESSNTDNPNVYGSFNGSKEEVVSAFAKRGWKVRKCTLVDFEVENEWSELIIEGREPECLIHGYVNNVNGNIRKIIGIIENVVKRWSLEIYDDKGNLLNELKQGT
jgi:hypothetical protein